MTGTGTEPDFDIAVVGGGIAGLVAARECAKRGLSVAIFEARDTVGGCVGRVALGDLTLDTGAEGFATRNGSVAALIEELGLGDDIIAPNPDGAWLVWGGPNGVDTAPLPKTSVVGIPANPLAEDVRRIIGWRGALRAYLDRIRPYLKVGRADSLGKLVQSRMGRTVLDRLVTPIASGVYSSDPMLLDVDRVAPGLNAELTRLGSLSGAVDALVGARKAGTAVLGIRGGMHRLADALLADIEKLGVEVHTGSRALMIGTPDAPTAADASDAEPDAASRDDAIDADDHTVRLVINADGTAKTVTAAHVIFASPTRLPASHGGDPADVEPTVTPNWPAATPIEIVIAVLHTDTLDSAPRGTGVLVADGTPGVAAKALTHSSAKWEWLANPGRPVVRLSYGRTGHPNPLEGLDSTETMNLVIADLNALLGVNVSSADIAALARTRWQDAASHATLGQAARVRALEKAVAEASGISVTGSWIAGTGLASVVPHAQQVGERAALAVLMPKSA